MFGKRKLREEVINLRNRVAYLEDKLCPAEQHDYVEAGRSYSFLYPDDQVEKIKYVCKRCGKVMCTQHYC